MPEPSAPPPVLRFDGLGHAYRPGAWVFRSCTASVSAGRILALLGPNGRGKTTVLKALLGVLKPTEGTVVCRGRTAFVPQLFQVTFDYTVLEVVLMGRARHVALFAQPSRRDEELALAALDRFGLAGRARGPFQELSGGERQMVIFARALVGDADILMLDEPTSSLDLRNQSVVLEWMSRLAHDDGLTIVFTTHHPQHALAIADDALLIIGASEFAFGPVDEVLTEANLAELYGVPLKRVAIAHGGRLVETLVPIFPARADAAGA